MASPATSVLIANAELPIRTSSAVHSGKVRAVYWLDKSDSRRLIERRGYAVAGDADLAVMVISDRISAFDCIWRAEGGLDGVPGKGAALNRIAAHWFGCFREQGLAESHILEIPHPLVWIVQRARPVKIEAIARQYMAGSMWRAYAAGERSFCGQHLPEGLQQHQRLPELLVTPSTKGVIEGIPDIPAQDDANISRADIQHYYREFGFSRTADVDLYEKLLSEGFRVIEQGLSRSGQILVDTKFEFGYVDDPAGDEKLIYMDEVGTPDSSRIWDEEKYRSGEVVENSKEAFRSMLLGYFSHPDVLLDKTRMPERQALARDTRLPAAAMWEVADIYRRMAEAITGQPLEVPRDPRQEILDSLSGDLDLVQ